MVAAGDCDAILGRASVVAVIFAAEDCYGAVSLRSFGHQGASPPFQLLLPGHVNMIVCDLQ